MKATSTVEQKRRLQIYLRQVGLWNEAIGFVFLALSAFMAVLYAGISKNSVFGGLFDLFSFAASLQITFWLIVGAMYLTSGWYLRQAKRNHTTAVLVGTIVVSIAGILNLLPVFPLVLAIVALTKANRLGMRLDTPGKSRSKFNLKKQLDLVAGLVLVAIAVLALIIANVHGGSASSASDTTFKLPKKQYATCEPQSMPGNCTVNSVKDGFSATFPGKPEITTTKSGTNPSDSSMPSIVQHTEYTLTNTSVKLRSSYHIEVIDFQRPVDITQSTIDQQTDNWNRLKNGPNPLSDFCETTDRADSLNGVAESKMQQATYLGLPALSVNMTGKTFGEETCTYASLSIAKDDKVYTLSHALLPGSAYDAELQHFLSDFKFTR
jgi:hypothetical protein